MSVVLATRRFQKEYPKFLESYRNLGDYFRDFLAFRAVHPQGSYDKHDSPVPASKFRRWHAVHGKAILLYQLHANEVRLITLHDHQYLEHGNWSRVNQFATGLVSEDFFQFDIDNPRPSVASHDKLRELEAADQVVTPSPTVAEQPDIPPEPVPAGEYTAHWEDRIVHYARGQQLLWEPRPAKPLVVIILEKDLLVPKGDALVFDVTGQKVDHLTRNELEAHFRRSAQTTTDLGEALTVAMQPDRPIETAAPEPEPHQPQAEPPVEFATDAEPEDLPAPANPPVDKLPNNRRDQSRVARLLVAMEHLHTDHVIRRCDLAMIRPQLEERDHRALSSTLITAQERGYVQKLTKKGPSGFYYQLTYLGKTESKRLNKLGIVALKQSQYETAA